MTLAELLPFPQPDALERAAAQLADTGVTRIDAALTNEAALGLHEWLREQTGWTTTFRQGERVWELPIAEAEAMGEARVRALASAGAAENFRYLYDWIRVPDDPAEREARDLPPDRLACAWTTPEALAIWRRLLGRDDIYGLTFKASRFRPGHFLTLHDDGADSEDGRGCRAAAIVLSLSPGWRADWGGMLNVFDDGGEVVRALSPRFNALSIFTVPRPHAVSMVAPFAPVPRLSFTGWLLAERG